MQVVLMVLLANYRFEITSNSNLTPQPAVTLRPHKDITATVIRKVAK
jgi:hypothetical protein